VATGRLTLVACLRLAVSTHRSNLELVLAVVEEVLVEAEAVDISVGFEQEEYLLACQAVRSYEVVEVGIQVDMY